MKSNRIKEERIFLQSENQKAIILDLDGTLIDFKTIDNLIINSVFEKNLFIKYLDLFLWIFNGLDIFPNRNGMLKIRLAMYSFFSKYKSNDLFEIYKKIYVNEVKKEIIFKEILLESLEKMGYKVFIISNNNLSKKVNHQDIIVPKEKKEVEIKKIMENYHVKYFIGNNYSDDIAIAKKLDIMPIYIGESCLVKKMSNKQKKFYCIKNIDDIIEIIK